MSQSESYCLLLGLVMFLVEVGEQNSLKDHLSHPIPSVLLKIMEPFWLHLCPVERGMDQGSCPQQGHLSSWGPCWELPESKEQLRFTLRCTGILKNHMPRFRIP